MASPDIYKNNQLPSKDTDLRSLTALETFDGMTLTAVKKHLNEV